MSDTPRNLTLERVNRLTDAVADLMESHAAQGRAVLHRLDKIEAHLGSLATDIRGLASEQALLGNRVENAFVKAMRANIRLDEIEDTP